MKVSFSRVMVAIFPIVALVLVLNFTALAGTQLFVFSANEDQPVELESAPGSEIEYQFVLANMEKERDANFEIYADAMILNDDEVDMPLEWIEILPSKNVYLEARKQTIITAVVKIPETTKAGKYKGGVSAKLVVSNDVGGVGVSMGAAIGNKILITVKGEAEKIIGSPIPEDEAISTESEKDSSGIGSKYYIYGLLALIVAVFIAFFFRRKN